MRSIRRAFTLVELLVVISILGVLASLVAINYSKSKLKAADANVKASIREYTQAMQLHYSQHKNYFVSDITQVCQVNYDASATNTGYRLSAKSGVLGAGCVGFRGGSMGRMTRKGVQVRNATTNVPTGTYPAMSIADALVGEGVLSAVQTYPGVSGFDSLADKSGDKKFNDFILTLCDAQGYQAEDPQSAVNFAILAQLNTPPSTGSTDATRTNTLCGTLGTGKGWNVFDTTQ